MKTREAMMMMVDAKSRFAGFSCLLSYLGALHQIAYEVRRLSWGMRHPRAMRWARGYESAAS